MHVVCNRLEVVEGVPVAQVPRAQDVLDLARHQQLLELGRQVATPVGDVEVPDDKDELCVFCHAPPGVSTRSGRARGANTGARAEGEGEGAGEGERERAQPKSARARERERELLLPSSGVLLQYAKRLRGAHMPSYAALLSFPAFSLLSLPLTPRSFSRDSPDSLDSADARGSSVFPHCPPCSFPLCSCASFLSFPSRSPSRALALTPGHERFVHVRSPHRLAQNGSRKLRWIPQENAHPATRPSARAGARAASQNRARALALAARFRARIRPAGIQETHHHLFVLFNDFND